MRPSRNLILVILLTILFSFQASTQVFNIDDYREFLQQHQNMNSPELLEMFPAGFFTAEINSSYNDALYFELIDSIYNLTEYEKSLLEDNGFMVSERLRKVSFGKALLEIFNDDLPVFVSTDAVLHAFHVSYDRILQDMEIGLLQPRLIELINSLRNSMQQLHNNYSSNPNMMTMLKDVDVYLTVPAVLMGQTNAPFYQENENLIDSVLSWIEAEQADTNILFLGNCRYYDWS